LAGGIGALGIGLGQQLLDLLRVRPTSQEEHIALAGGLGLGALAYSFLTLGLIGLLRPWAIWSTLGLALIWAWPKMRRWPSRWRENPPSLSLSSLFERLGVTLVLVMLAIVLVRGLAPVTDYDGLTYHLVIPRDYLQVGRIYPRPGESHANFPLTVDLLYIPAIMLGLENAAKLIHLGCGLLMGLGTFALASQIMDSRRAGWLAIFVLGTTPVIGTVGGYAHTDLGWALFEFLAAYAVLRWQEEDRAIHGHPTPWLILAGTFAGLGLGSKYLGLPVLGVLGLAILIAGYILNLAKGGLLVRWPGRRALGAGLLFGMVAVVVAAPWYLKNWFGLGNPFYPLWFGGRGWDAHQLNQLQSMGTRYGPREGILGLLLLPWDLFFHSIGYFGPIPFAFPPPLSLLLLFYPLSMFFIPAHRRRALNVILLITLFRFGTWAISARNARYLMDIHPLLSVAVACLLMELDRWRWLRRLTRGLVCLFLVVNLVWQTALLVQEGSIPVVLGLESYEEYLVDHNDPPYRAIRFINQLPSDSKVFFVGNGQSYYVTTEHLVDVNHANWGHLIYLYGEEPEQLRQALVSQGFTHIFYSGYDFEWQLKFDAEGEVAEELALFDRFADRCARLIYDEGEAGQVYKLLSQCK
jgi:hypothetical protein